MSSKVLDPSKAELFINGKKIEGFAEADLNFDFERPKKISRGLYSYKGFRIEKYEEGDLKGCWDIVASMPNEKRLITGPYKRLKHALLDLKTGKIKKI